MRVRSCVSCVSGVACHACQELRVMQLSKARAEMSKTTSFGDLQEQDQISRRYGLQDQITKKCDIEDQDQITKKNRS